DNCRCCSIVEWSTMVSWFDPDGCGSASVAPHNQDRMPSQTPADALAGAQTSIRMPADNRTFVRICLLHLRAILRSQPRSDPQLGKQGPLRKWQKLQGLKSKCRLKYDSGQIIASGALERRAIKFRGTGEQSLSTLSHRCSP